MTDINTYTTAEISALTPQSGDLVLNTDDDAVQLWNGSAWKVFNSDVSPGPFNEYSLSFDGAGDYVSTGLDVGGASALTFSAWVKHDSVANAAIVSQYVGSGNRAFRLSMYPNTASWAGLRLDAYNSSNTNFGTNYLLDPVISAGVWYHAAFVFTGSAITVYYNGNASPTVSMTGVLDSVTRNVDIGSSGGSSEFMDGKIDEVGVWTSALSASDITDIYNGGVPADISTIGNSGNGPDAWYRMEEGSGGSVVNTANPGTADGTINGATFVSGTGNIPG